MQLEEFNYPVYYLEKIDFDNNGNIINKNIPTDKPIFIMIQASWCPHCTHAKPDYQEFANRNQESAFVCTIQADGKEPGEVNIKNIIPKIYSNFAGYPSYIVYYKGRRIPFENGRQLQDLENFLHTLKTLQN